ncbi:MAG: aspartate 1-decarboxylase [Dehalococcoidia bacterium]|nr:aspartate 1-decarboxylase [Dehalococcoidia bacterium]
MRMMLRGKIHRATVTSADLEYVGSISIDRMLLEAAGIVEWEQVHVLDVTNGARLTTYAIEAPAGSGEICVNGAAAHLVNPGDMVIILNYEGVPTERIEEHHPRLVHVDGANRIVDLVTGEAAVGQFAQAYDNIVSAGIAG